MCGLDVINPKTGAADPKLREKILQAAYDRGLILLGCGESAIRFCPPLCITAEELETGVALFDQAIASVG
jgi:4-aminobutyrate aminotransferase